MKWQMRYSMILNTKIFINGKLKETFQMYKDKRVKNQFTAKRWIQSMSIDDDDMITASIRDDANVLVELELILKHDKEKKVYHAAIDTHNLFAWANLTEGYGDTWGFTACVMLRRKVPAAQLSLSECAAMLRYDEDPGA
jgi:hypothetical protein